MASIFSKKYLETYSNKKEIKFALASCWGNTDKTINFHLKSNSFRIFRLTEALLFWETNKYVLDEYFQTYDKMMSGQQSNDFTFYLYAFNLSP